ncbi:MAG: hypothetical protein HOE69_05885 [Euryarchaeota archaeon]|jgi:hypothetical protein|nr:hypothetical protein [Euryarchaeota archaeon]
MVEVTFRDLVVISLVMGIMSATMATMLAYFSTGMAGAPSEAVDFGVMSGLAVSGLTLIYGGWRLFEIKRGGKEKEEVDKVAFLRKLLASLEPHGASLPWSTQKPWRTSTHIRKERGTLTLDLHDMDLAGSRRILDLVIENRPMIGRLRIVTGRGNNSKGRPVIRPMVSERLDNVARALDWQMLANKGSITLRPLGKRPTLKKWLIRFLFFVGPFSIALALSFEELAGSGAREQGRIFGAIAGIILTGLLASYRNRV